MDYPFYLDKFHGAANLLSKSALDSKQLEASVGIVMDAVFLKLYKKHWSNNANDPLNATSRIFFSIWISDKTIQQKRIYYNIHALKMRYLKSYPIPSRLFAERFRTVFKPFEQDWENVSTKYGPLTLMEGWIKLDVEQLKNSILKLASAFITIDYLIDETLDGVMNYKL